MKNEWTYAIKADGARIWTGHREPNQRQIDRVVMAAIKSGRNVVHAHLEREGDWLRFVCASDEVLAA